MGGGRVPGQLGPDAKQFHGDVDPQFPTGGFEFRGPIELGDTPIVSEVIKDWDPPRPSTTPEIVVKGKTLAQLEPQLNALREWGRAGGSPRSEILRNVKTPEVRLHVFANLVFVLPRWDGYDEASDAAKAEWDRMVAKLRVHEERHLENAIEEADALASRLIGEPISRIATLVTEANAILSKRQSDLDKATDGGRKPGVPYGDVELNISIK
jgi:hypothetical protein